VRHDVVKVLVVLVVVLGRDGDAACVVLVEPVNIADITRVDLALERLDRRLDFVVEQCLPEKQYKVELSWEQKNSHKNQIFTPASRVPQTTDVPGCHCVKKISETLMDGEQIE
jgi:hypothetical protein